MDATNHGPGHNSGESQIGGIAAEALRQGIERWERLDEEKKAISEDQKEVLAGLKAQGFDVRIIRKIIQLRRMEDSEREEMEQILELYRAALGML